VLIRIEWCRLELCEIIRGGSCYVLRHFQNPKCRFRSRSLGEWAHSFPLSGKCRDRNWLPILRYSFLLSVFKLISALTNLGFWAHGCTQCRVSYRIDVFYYMPPCVDPEFPPQVVRFLNIGSNQVCLLASQVFYHTLLTQDCFSANPSSLYSNYRTWIDPVKLAFTLHLFTFCWNRWMVIALKVWLRVLGIHLTHMV
jgi:hypothetical protein